MDLFDSLHREKALRAHTVRVALATNGSSPYGMAVVSYICWSVFVIPLILPSSIIFQRQHILLLFIIPRYPRDTMSVYMELLIIDLLCVWEDGVWTYDWATNMNFKMHMWYMYSLHDMPTYGLFWGWCLHRKFSYPVCKAALMFIWWQVMEKT
jgi:hypothetical protein